MKFGRRNRDEVVDDASTTDVDATDAEAAVDPRADGPWDHTEFEIPADQPAFIDLGGLVVRGRVGLDLQIPKDEGTDRLAAVLLVTEDAAVEIRAFAAPRTGGLWDEVRAEIAEEVQRLEGQVVEVDGPHGPELQVQVPARTPDGQEAVQPSRIVGVEGPRWFLRGTFMGRAALEPATDGVLERGFREVVVRRGNDAMPPREPIEITLPAGAVPAGEQVVADDSAESDQDPTERDV
ncbi:MAG: DUF3710 domain-containing protein [Nocardioidaceae bacterium]|nr:DUF3710 domain-containing protein [Nocardioidaceae bacterium]